jgi:hypothetical protein
MLFDPLEIRCDSEVMESKKKVQIDNKAELIHCALQDRWVE